MILGWLGGYGLFSLQKSGSKDIDVKVIYAFVMVTFDQFVTSNIVVSIIKYWTRRLELVFNLFWYSLIKNILVGYLDVWMTKLKGYKINNWYSLNKNI